MTKSHDMPSNIVLAQAQMFLRNQASSCVGQAGLLWVKVKVALADVDDKSQAHYQEDL